MAVENDIIGAVNLTSSLATIGDVLLWGFVILGTLGLIYLIYYLMSFKNVLIIRDAVNQRKIISKKRWKEVKDRKKNIWLATPFNKIKKSLPPSEAIDITPKGRKWVEAYRGEDTESLIWIKDTFNYKKFKEENPEFEPVTTQERELLINELAKSEAYKVKSTWEIILQISLIMAPIILIAVIGLVLGDITEGLNQYAQPLTSTLNNVADSFVTASENLAGIQNADIAPVEVPN